MKRQGLVGLMLVITLSLAGCNRGEMDSEAAPTATPIPTETVEIKVRLTVDREVPSMVERFLEVQVVESVGGVMTTEAPVAAVTTKAAVDHTQGLPSEESVSIELNAEPGKEYGLRAGVFDGPERGVMLLSGDCVEADACRFYGGSNLNVHRLNLIPAVAQETFYEKSVPVTIRAKCQLPPDPMNCGVPRTMQYYDAANDTCYPASWRGCGEVTPFKNAGECIQACRKQWP